MKRAIRKFSGQGGFTMLEMIAVLVVIGIITVVAVVKMNKAPQTYDLASEVEVIKSHLRLAQARAMGSSSPCGINFASATTYYLFQGTGSTTPVLMAGEDNATINLVTKKSTLTITSATPQRITFDAYGSPGTANVTVTTSGGSIVITQNTGFIP